MKKLLLILTIVFILSGCMSMMGYTPVTVNGIPAHYSDYESIEFGKIVTIGYAIANDEFSLSLTHDVFSVVLEKTLSNTSNFYQLELKVYRNDWLFLKEFKIKVDGQLITLKDSEPSRDVFSGGKIVETLNPIIEENLVKLIANTKSPIYLQYKSSDPIVIEGEQLQKVKQYAEGLLTINSLNDLGI